MNPPKKSLNDSIPILLLLLFINFFIFLVTRSCLALGALPCSLPPGYNCNWLMSRATQLESLFWLVTVYRFQHGVSCELLSLSLMRSYRHSLISDVFRESHLNARHADCSPRVCGWNGNYQNGIKGDRVQL